MLMKMVEEMQLMAQIKITKGRYNRIQYEQEEYYSLFRDTVKWIRKNRKN